MNNRLKQGFYLKLTVCCILLVMPESGFPIGNIQQHASDTLAHWEEGYLDIYHINTGQGDTAFFIFPDGTTMLIDAGDMNTAAFNNKNAPKKATTIHPDSSKRTGEWIAHFIRQVFPKSREPEINYAVISHYHGDHYGVVEKQTPQATEGGYKLTGITDVGSQVPIRKMIDRGEDFPLSLAEYYRDNPTYTNYRKFIQYQKKTSDLTYEALRPGAKDQIVLKKYPKEYRNFHVRNIKANGTIWTGSQDSTFEYFQPDEVLNASGRFNENPLSLGIKISYGPFDYFTGGDMTGLQGYGLPGWFDVETPVSQAVGKVEVTTLNHHGNRDATNRNFIQNLAPRVVVQQSWCSDHPGQEVLHRLNHYGMPRDIFATNMHPETISTLGFWLNENYKSMAGHVLVRVERGGKHYKVFILDDEIPSLKVIAEFGPYKYH